jgi:hypothetical protein
MRTLAGKIRLRALPLLLAAPLLAGCVVTEAPHHGYYPAHAHYAPPPRPIYYPRRVWVPPPPPPRHHYHHHHRHGPRHHHRRHHGWR